MTAVADQEIEMTLDAAGLTWTRRVESWAVTPPGGVAREVHVTPTPDGVRVDAILIDGDEATPEALEALELFLQAGARDLPGVRCVLEGTRAKLLAEVAGDQIEARLGEVLRTVSTGCRLLARGARALLAPDLARQYLAFHGGHRVHSPDPPDRLCSQERRK